MGKMQRRIDRVVSSANRWMRYPSYSMEWRRVSSTAYASPEHEPQWQELRSKLPPVVKQHFDERWSKDRPPAASAVPFEPLPEYQTDIIYTGTFKADAHKDLAALRQHRPDIKITALMSGPMRRETDFVRRLCDDVVFVRTQAQFVRFLLNARAKALVFQGGDDQFALLTSCIWPGRLVWQVRDTNLRIPRQYLSDLTYERAKFIAERADAILTFHSEDGWKNLTDIQFRSPPRCIPPLCVPSIGPRCYLPKLSANDGGIHVVHASSVGRVGGNHSGTINFTQADFLQKFRSIAEQGVHMHVYSPHLDRETPEMKEYFDLQRSSQYFHIHRALPFEQLLETLTQYDWGMLHVTWQKEYLLPGFDRPVQNGLVQHIQSGLPVIVSPTAVGNADLVRNTGRGIVVDERDIPRLRQLLEQRKDLPRHCGETPLEPSLLYDAGTFGRAVLGE